MLETLFTLLLIPILTMGLLVASMIFAVVVTAGIRSTQYSYLRWRGKTDKSFDDWYTEVLQKQKDTW